MAEPKAGANPIGDMVAQAVGSITPILALVATLLGQAKAIWAAFKAANPTAVVDALTGKFYKSVEEALADGALQENLKTELPKDSELIDTFARNAAAGKQEAHEAAEWAKSLITAPVGPPGPAQ